MGTIAGNVLPSSLSKDSCGLASEFFKATALLFMPKSYSQLFGFKLFTQKKQFKLFRNFSAISLVGFALTTGLLSEFYRQQATRNLVFSTEEANVTLTQVFANTFWPTYGNFLSSTQSLSDRDLATSPTIRQLMQDVLGQLEGLSVAKVKVYDLQGRTVFSTSPTQIGHDKSKSAGFLAGKSGKVISQLGHRDTFRALNETLENRSLLSSYIPIYASGQREKVVAVFEVYNDVTPLVHRIKRTQRNIAMGSLLALASLYGVLALFVRRADRFIERQYQQLQASERSYREQTDELESVLADLKQTQVQMLHSEKMSGLGQMVAGVAHEINNPANFIYGNLQHVRNYTEDILGLLGLYEKVYAYPTEEIQQWNEDIDIDHIKEDLGKILTSMETGTSRIREIVLSLRNFSRLDESDCKTVDIHAGIENTLMILQHRLKETSNRPRIEVIRDFDVLPVVECYPSQLNQVFMSILANSIDALDSAFEQANIPEKMPTLTLRTEVRCNCVVVSIADNGVGMPADVKCRIFDPFFTTKSVGKGTGMGLAIAHQIVVKTHKGKIDCFSDEGKGTEFVVEIPVQLEKAAAWLR